MYSTMKSPGIVVLEPVLVLERIVHLGEGHRTGLEPAVEHLGDAAHHRTSGRIVGVGTHEIVDLGPVQVGDRHPEVGFEFGE
jgi:hypothetical protein